VFLVSVVAAAAGLAGCSVSTNDISCRALANCPPGDYCDCASHLCKSGPTGPALCAASEAGLVDASGDAPADGSGGTDLVSMADAAGESNADAGDIRSDQLQTLDAPASMLEAGTPADGTTACGSGIVCAGHCVPLLYNEGACGLTGNPCAAPDFCNDNFCSTPVTGGTLSADLMPLPLTTDGTAVYWALDLGLNSNVRAWSPSMGVFQVASGEAGPISMTTGGGDLYWFNDNGTFYFLRSAPLGTAGATPSVLTPNLATRPVGLVWSQNTLYWMQGPVIESCPQTGCTAGGPVTVGPGVVGTPTGLAIDGTGNFYVTETSPSDVVMITGSVEVSYPVGGIPASPVIYDGWVYVADDDACGDIVRMPVGGGAVDVAVTAANYPDHLSVDPTGLYWIENQSQIMKQPFCTNTPVQLSTAISATGLAITSGTVVWTQHTSGTSSGVFDAVK
jgi:hypothetical protein